MVKMFLLALVFLTANLMVPEKPGAQDRVRVGWAAMTASHTPLWVAQDKGFLAKQGLSVESIFFSAGPPAMQALVAGDLDIVVTSAPNVVNPRLGGADTVMILSIIPTFIDHIVSTASITTHRAVAWQDRFGQSFRQYLGDGVAAVVAPPRHRSGKRREDRAGRWNPERLASSS